MFRAAVCRWIKKYGRRTMYDGYDDDGPIERWVGGWCILMILDGNDDSDGGHCKWL